MNRTATAVINLQALKHNFKRAKYFSPQSKIMCVVKSNAYGHGLAEVAQTLTEADGFGVSCIVEAIQLRKLGIKQPICVFQGFLNCDDIEACIEYKLQPVIHQSRQFELISNLNTKSKLEYWLKVSTGMNRLGFAEDDFNAVWEKNRSLENVFCAGLMTHMCCADGVDDVHNDYTKRQITLFHQLTEGLSVEKSLANSATLIAWPEEQMDWVRPGIILYGVSPFETGQADELGLIPVMSLKTKLIAVNMRKKGQSIGYGATWKCAKNTKIGIAAIGYGDGYPRNIENNTPVLVNNQLARIVGRVSMDMITIDLTGIDDVAIGNEVTLWGEDLAIERIAASAKMISYELLCNIYGRVNYIYD